ncbi:MAG: C_GCAxxG_C_C family protein [Anaerolineaceae bacterium]|nr:C_GCAxxG_C_C family protein [Anaerolineaceae bacterium]
MIDFDSLRHLTIEERAVELRGRRICNCCQAVTAALTEDPQLIQASAGFGGGMGNTQGVCGALVGAVIAAGIKTEGSGTTRYAKLIQERFRERSGAIICRELKGLDTGKVLCSCEDCVRNAVRSFQEIMN